MPPRKLPKNWISSYSEIISPISEAPDAYVIWSAISVVSAVLKKKVFVQRGTYEVYPNQYIVLVGPPGVGKGSAINPAHSFVKDFKPVLSNYLSDRITAQEIIKRLDAGFPSFKMVGGIAVTSNEATAVLMASELSTFLGSSDWMTSFLCSTWDQNEFEYSTKNMGSQHIKGMCVSLMGACVPDFIRAINGKQNAVAAVNGGFTARTMFIFANEKSKNIPFPLALKNIQNVPQNRGKTGLETIADLRHDLERIAELNGEFAFSPEARNEFINFYNKIKILDSDSDVVRHFKSRQNIHVLKVAMCLSAAGGDSLILSEWDIKMAIALVQQVLNTLDVTFRGVGESSLAEATAKIQNYIERKGLTNRRELIRDNHRHATPDDIDRILNILIQMDFIKAYSQGGNQFYEFIKPGSGPAGKANAAKSV